MTLATLGLGGGLITQGYGYAAVVVPIVGPPRRPAVGPSLYAEIIPLKQAIILANLNIIQRGKLSIQLHSLSYADILKLRILLSDLKIILPTEIQNVVDGLSLMASDSIGVSLDELKAVKRDIREISLKELREVREAGKVYHVNRMNLALRLRESITAQIPNIYNLKVERLIKYMDLMDLLDRLEATEES